MSEAALSPPPRPPAPPVATAPELPRRPDAPAPAADEFAADMLAGTIAALRRRADRQRKRAADWTVTGANGVRIMAGEGRIAERIAETFDQLANELEAEAAR
jgi:hypothetical protein